MSLHSILSNRSGSDDDDGVSTVEVVFPCIDRGILEFELDLTNPSMDDLSRRVDDVPVADDAAVAVLIEAPPTTSLL